MRQKIKDDLIKHFSHLKLLKDKGHTYHYLLEEFKKLTGNNEVSYNSFYNAFNKLNKQGDNK